MKLIRINIISADTCGGILDGFEISFRDYIIENKFSPFCLIGPNGAGKSQFIQIIAEIFQSIFHAVVEKEERVESNPGLQFEIEYIISPDGSNKNKYVKISRKKEGRKKSDIIIEISDDGQNYKTCNDLEKAIKLLPSKIIGYTSGGNETLSLPFLLSRGGYASEVAENALSSESTSEEIPDTRLLLIDYSTNLEVLVSNLLLFSSDEEKESLLKDAHLKDIHSFRCIIQLAHSAAPKIPSQKQSNRKGVQLTNELEKYINQLQNSSTAYSYDEKTETYIFDYFVTNATREAFSYFWESTLKLYSSFHKISMLNDLMIPKKTRDKYRKEIKDRRFAARLPEPNDDEKVFRFERVNFVNIKNEQVGYVALSDGEHQLAQILGTLSMISYSNVLFLLDEPESHFNPKWRVGFLSKILNLPTKNGKRTEENSKSAKQECLITTHAPFVPSDMPMENVLIFSKNVENGKIEVRTPQIQTFGSKFDDILDECFDVRPPMSKLSREEIDNLMDSEDIDEIKKRMKKLGHTVEKMFLADRIRELQKKGK
jgi:restriction system-associated AAA family ATPase